ncbi:serine carboxypeptidase-like protein, partial [Trifolium medium]|nr:serine carboxypeptidase-like protein [Trifolium medium]
GLFVAIATSIVLLAYYLNQHSVDLELHVSDLPPQGSEADKVIRLLDQPEVDFQQFAGYIIVDEKHIREISKMRSMKPNATKHESPKIPGNDNGAISDANDGVVVQHSTSFSMMLNNVQDYIVLGDIQIDDPVLQQVTFDDVVGVTVTNEDLDQVEEETYDNSSCVPDTQLAFVKQDDAVEVEKPFTPEILFFRGHMSNTLSGTITLSKSVSERSADVSEVHIRVDKEEEIKYNVTVIAVVLFIKNVKTLILLIKAWSDYYSDCNGYAESKVQAPASFSTLIFNGSISICLYIEASVEDHHQDSPASESAHILSNSKVV